MKKKLILILTGVALVILVVLFFGPKTFSFYKQQWLTKKYLKEFESIEMAYKSDPYGGVTPKETLDGFIAELKKGDTEKAVTYFVPEKRGEMKKELLIGLKSGGIDLLLKSFEKNKKYIDLTESNKRIEMINNSEIILTVDFLKNKFTNKWLIESL